MGKKSSKRGQREGVGRESVGEREYFFFLLFASFLDLRKSDHRFPSGLKAKLIYATITPKSWSFVKLYMVGNFPTSVISSLKAI